MTKIKLKNIIENHIKYKTFQLYGQKISCVASPSEGDGIEVLFRIMDQHQLISAHLLIPIAEEIKGLIQRIDLEVLKKLIHLSQTQEYLSHLTFFSINLSATSLSDADFFKKYLAILSPAKEFCKKICIELTETHMINNIYFAKKHIEQLKALDCKIALDDFGTGFNSFYYLKELPIDFIKIDGHFIKHLIQSNKDQTILKCIQHTAQALNIKTIAECVEDKLTFDLLKTLNIDFMQGFWVEHPKPLHRANYTLKVS